MLVLVKNLIEADRKSHPADSMIEMKITVEILIWLFAAGVPAVTIILFLFLNPASGLL